jgi:hypothetical protein
LATISSGLYLFLLIRKSSFGLITIHQGGSLFRGQANAHVVFKALAIAC